jgi:hypothetical protein
MQLQAGQASHERAHISYASCAMTRSGPRAEGSDLRCALLAAATLLTAMLVACAGRADEEPPFTIGPKPSWYLLAGVTTGGTLVANERVARSKRFSRRRDAQDGKVTENTFEDDVVTAT